MFGQNISLQPVPIQSLSELERATLQEVVFVHLQRTNLGCQITIPKDGPKRRKSFRLKLDSLAKEKKDKELNPLGFGIPLSQVIINDRALKKKQGAAKEGRRHCLALETTVMTFRARRQHKHLSKSNMYLNSETDFRNEPISPIILDTVSRGHRRGALCVDSIVDLDDNQSRLLEALQLSLPAELEGKRVARNKEKHSLNPIYQQVPRIVQQCCQHIETYGLQTVGIFRVGSSKKRVRQLREEFDQGLDVSLDEELSVHDVAALLKEFLRDMPDPLLPRELYTAFINTVSLGYSEQLSVLKLLIYLLAPCNCDTLLRLLEFLATVASHAHDSVGQDGQEIIGNKMTAPNLATIFGPNLLQREKSLEKDYSAEAEESSSVINVLQRLIENHDSLFTVCRELQDEVLTRLLKTDADVVHYLLRRRRQDQAAAEEGTGSLGTMGIHSPKSVSHPGSVDMSPTDLYPSLGHSPNPRGWEEETEGPHFTVPAPHCGHTQPHALTRQEMSRTSYSCEKLSYSGSRQPPAYPQPPADPSTDPRLETLNLTHPGGSLLRRVWSDICPASNSLTQSQTEGPHTHSADPPQGQGQGGGHGAEAGVWVRRSWESGPQGQQLRPSGLSDGLKADRMRETPV